MFAKVVEMEGFTCAASWWGGWEA
jgi:hypothetical protein